MKKQNAIIYGVAGVGALGLLWLATQKVSPPPPKGCTSNSDCPLGFICNNGTCVLPTNCTSSSQCPNGYVCQYGLCVKQVQQCTSSSQCPPGQTCQSGTCKPCPSQICPCGYTWDSVNCACGALQPAVLLAPQVAAAQVNYLSYWNCGIPDLTWGEASASTPCNFWPPIIGPPSPIISVTPFTITLADDHGHPICNKHITASVYLAQTGLDSFNWTTQDGLMTGSITLSLTYGTDLFTDARGKAAVNISTNMQVDLSQTTLNINNSPFACTKFIGTCNKTSYQSLLPVIVEYYYAENQAIRGATSVQLSTSICGEYC